jgi:hypothetical protein
MLVKFIAKYSLKGSSFNVSLVTAVGIRPGHQPQVLAKAVLNKRAVIKMQVAH